MSTTSTDPAELEAELDRERAELASTLDALSDRVSVDNLAKNALGAFKSRAGDYTSTIDSAVRSNPVAVAMIGAGVAWLLLGNRGASKSTRYAGPEHDDLSTGYGEGTTTASSTYTGTGYQTTTMGDGSTADDDHSWSRDAQGLRARAMAALRRIESEARSYYANLTGGSGSGDRDYESERRSVLSSFTGDLRARFSQGLEGLSDASRERVVAARERAYAASLRAERMGRDAVADPARLLEEHPLVAGAVAFALGAAAGAALPATEAENRAFGADRDRLMDEASRVLRSERERAMQLAGSLGQELKAAAQETLGAAAGAAQETLGAAASAAADKATEAANRVAERVTEQVDRVAGQVEDSVGGTGGTGSTGAGRGGPTSGGLSSGSSISGGSTSGGSISGGSISGGGPTSGTGGIAGPGDPVIG